MISADQLCEVVRIFLKASASLTQDLEPNQAKQIQERIGSLEQDFQHCFLEHNVIGMRQKVQDMLELGNDLSALLHSMPNGFSS